MQPHNIPATNGHDSWSTPGPSRAINVKTLRPDVEALCAKHKVTISAIESLPLGAGTRVVLMNGDDAAVMRRAFGKNVIEGKVDREHWGTLGADARRRERAARQFAPGDGRGFAAAAVCLGKPKHPYWAKARQYRCSGLPPAGHDVMVVGGIEGGTAGEIG